MLYIHEMGERPDLGDRIAKYLTSWKRVEYWQEINAGVKTTAACLGECDPSSRIFESGVEMNGGEIMPTRTSPER